MINVQYAHEIALELYEENSRLYALTSVIGDWLREREDADFAVSLIEILEERICDTSQLNRLIKHLGGRQA